jgi:hypothetical protein
MTGLGRRRLRSRLRLLGAVAVLLPAAFLALAAQSREAPPSAVSRSASPGSAPGTLDVDGSGVATAQYDSTLILYWLFGFRGVDLAVGRVDPESCTRCDASSIDAYLADVAPDLDIDDDGTLGALTDGAMIRRFLSGFGREPVGGMVGQDAAGNSFVGSDCSRCTEEELEAYLESIE